MSLPRPRYSLVPLLVLATTLFSLLVFVGVGAMELIRERQRLLQTAVQGADAAIALSVPPMALALWNFDPDGLRELGRSLVREGGIVEVELRVDGSDRPVRVVRDGWSGKGATSVREIDLRVPARQAPIGKLRVVESTGEINQQIVDQALARLPLELLKVAATAIGLLLLLHALVTRRLQAMVAALARLRTDDPQAHLPVPHDAEASRDEIVVLAVAVNRFHHAQGVEVVRRREAEDHLREQLHERSVILGSLRDALLTLDNQGQVRYANPAASSLLGCPPQTLAGRSLAGLAQVHGVADAAGAEEDLQAWIARAATRPGERTARVRVLPAQASAFEAEALVNRLAGTADAALSIVIYDVSESGLRERAELARERAEAASMAKTQFLSRMSHELRTPLNAIVGFAQTLEHDAVVSADPQRLAQVQLIGRAGWHLTRMIGDVLELSRIEAGSLRLELRPLDLRPLLTDALAYVRAEAAIDGIELETRIDDEACHVLADSLRLEQVLVNLLSNAVKYNRPGGHVLVIVMAPGDDSVAIQIQDTGLGMDSTQVAQLYQSFNRLGRESTSKPGTGIGLVVTRALVDLMHGRLELESQAGAGSTFTVHLPRAARAAVAAGPAVGTAAAPASTYGARRVVYVEDDAVNAQVMQALLMRRPQVQLRVCDTLDAGWAAIGDEPPDLVLMDMQLPDGSGIDLLLRMKAAPMLSAVPVLMVSADAMNDSVDAALAAGARAYLTKPLDFDEALRQIDAMLMPLPARGPVATG